MDLHFLPLLIPLGIFSYAAYRFFRYGSFIGMMIGARVGRQLGEVDTVSVGGMRQVLKVFALERELGQEAQVAVSMVSKSILSVHLRAMKLTAHRAQELARLLEAAAKG